MDEVLGLDAFWDQFALKSVKMTLGENLLQSSTEKGEVLTARRGARLWRGVATVTLNTGDNQDQAVALVEQVQEAGVSFLINDPKRVAPQADPSGALQGGATVRVAAVDENDLRNITLEGLPTGFVLTRGDMVSIAYGSNPVRYYLGRVRSHSVFSGIVPRAVVRLGPHVPRGVAVGDVATVRGAVCRAKYVPGSYSGVVRLPVLDDGFSFEWVQTNT